jgi:hypothetical protein
MNLSLLIGFLALGHLVFIKYSLNIQTLSKYIRLNYQ